MEEIQDLKRQVEELNTNLKKVIAENEFALKRGEIFDNNQMTTLTFLKDWQKRTEVELKSIEDLLMKQ